MSGWKPNGRSDTSLVRRHPAARTTLVDIYSISATGMHDMQYGKRPEEHENERQSRSLTCIRQSTIAAHNLSCSLISTKDRWRLFASTQRLDISLPSGSSGASGPRFSSKDIQAKMVKLGNTSDKKEATARGSSIGDHPTSRILKERLQSPFPGLWEGSICGAAASRMMLTDFKEVQ